MAHRDSALFNLGVAILDADGAALWAEPRAFLSEKSSFATKPWFLETRDRRAAQVVQPDPKRPVLYVISPIMREGRFTGALLGGTDLTDEPMMAELRVRPTTTMILATGRGGVVYPLSPPKFTHSADWFSIFQGHPDAPRTSEVVFDGKSAVVATARVPIGNLFLLSTEIESDLFRDSDARLRTRLALGVFLALAPMLALVLFLRRSLTQFQRSETEAMREENLRNLGEAANVIAHEVRNSLNGIGMGFDLLTDKHRRPSDRVLTELRAEMERLSTFAYQLMMFAKNPEPQRAPVDLSEMVPRWLALTRDVAAETGVIIELTGADRPILVEGDPMLLQIIVGNLVSNALDAVASANPPRIVVALSTSATAAEVRVEDNGKGVDDALRDRLFEPFVTGKPSGVGMGLSISRKIARAHGGDLSLEPRNPGASFVLTLPLEAT